MLPQRKAEEPVHPDRHADQAMLLAEAHLQHASPTPTHQVQAFAATGAIIPIACSPRVQRCQRRKPRLEDGGIRTLWLPQHPSGSFTLVPLSDTPASANAIGQPLSPVGIPDDKKRQSSEKDRYQV
jgi:hypothetical protein